MPNLRALEDVDHQVLVRAGWVAQDDPGDVGIRLFTTVVPGRHTDHRLDVRKRHPVFDLGPGPVTDWRVGVTEPPGYGADREKQHQYCSNQQAALWSHGLFPAL